MKPIKNTGNARQSTTESFKTTKALKRSLLLTFGTLVPCVAGIIYSILKLEDSEDTDMQKISLLFSALALPIYVIVLLLKESIATKRDRKKITEMVTELAEGITTEEAIPGQRTNHKTEALVRKIVQVINA